MIVVVCAAFVLTVSEAKTEIMCLRTKEMPEPTAIFSVGQPITFTTKQMSSYTSGGGGDINHNTDLSIQVNRRISNAWCSFWKYTLELYDRPSTPFELKLLMLRFGVLETMLYGDGMWSPRTCHYDTLRRAHHSFLPRCTC